MLLPLQQSDELFIYSEIKKRESERERKESELCERVLDKNICGDANGETNGMTLRSRFLSVGIMDFEQDSNGQDLKC